MAAPGTPAEATRERIVRAAAGLLADGGRDAVSTRAVGRRAGVQAPTIYRIFGDKQGLLRAVAADGFADYLRGESSRALAEDPVEDLRTGWDLHVAFGLANPFLYLLIYAEPGPEGSSSVAAESVAVVASRVDRIAHAGRLRVGADRATHLVHAAGCGTTLELITAASPEGAGALSSAAREAVVAAVTTDPTLPSASTPVTAAIALRAVIEQTPVLGIAERLLLLDWLDRLTT